jgi:ubiquinone/menaquinone biosynthesis C-methylase UbiE
MRSSDAPDLPMSERWNHNIHYNPVLTNAVPAGSARVLDVGCGEGVLAHPLSARIGPVGRVVGLDPHEPSIGLARRHAGAADITYVVGDVLAAPFPPGSFDAVVANTVLHHMDTAEALERMGELVRPGGTLAVVGVARSGSALDVAYDLVAAVATRLHRLRKGWWETSAPKVWPPAETYGSTRRIVADVLPGARFRRHILWRWSAVWTRPVAGDAG